MPFINADRIKETTTTTGTGAITLAGAVLGFRAFYPTLSVGDTFKYFIVSTSGTEWESGLGTLTASSTLARTTVQSSSNVNPLTAVNFSAGLKEVGIGPTAGGETPWNPVTNTLDISVNALNDVAITSPTVNQVLKYSGTEWTNQADAVNVGTVTSVSGAGTVSGLTLTGTVTSSGSLTLGGAISTLNQSTTGNAATVTTNANLTGHVTSVGNTAVLGSFTSAQLATALTDETGTGANVFATSPTLVTPLSNSLSAVPVGSGAGNSLILSAGTGVGVGAGGNVETKPGTQGSSGGDGRNYWRTSGSVNTRPGSGWSANTSNVVAYSIVGSGGFNTFNIGPDESNWSTNSATHWYADTPLAVRHPSEASTLKHIAAFYTSNANKSMIVFGASLTEAHVSASWGVSGTAIDLVFSSITAAGSGFVNLRLKATGETQVTGFLTTNSIAAIPVASGLTASVTAASSSGGILTYTATNTFTVGRTVSVTGLTTASGSTLNIAGMTIATASSSQFTVVNATVGVSSGTGTATAGGNTIATSASNAVTAGPGGNYTITAGSGVGVGKGGDIILQPGAQGSSGGNGRVLFFNSSGVSTGIWDANTGFISGGSDTTTIGAKVKFDSNGYILMHAGLFAFANSNNNLGIIATLPDTFGFRMGRQGFFGFSNDVHGANWTSAAFDAGIGRAAAGVVSVVSSTTSGTGGSLSFPSATTAIAANTNDLALPASAFQRLNCTSTSNLTGIAPPSGGAHVDGRMIRVYNVGTANLTLTHNSGLSTTANRYWNSTAADIVLAPNDYAELIYDIINNGSGASGWRAS